MSQRVLQQCDVSIGLRHSGRHNEYLPPGRSSSSPIILGYAQIASIKGYDGPEAYLRSVPCAPAGRDPKIANMSSGSIALRSRVAAKPFETACVGRGRSRSLAHMLLAFSPGIHHRSPRSGNAATCQIPYGSRLAKTLQRVPENAGFSTVERSTPKRVHAANGIAAINI